MKYFYQNLSTENEIIFEDSFLKIEKRYFDYLQQKIEEKRINRKAFSKNILFSQDYESFFIRERDSITIYNKSKSLLAARSFILTFLGDALRWIKDIAGVFLLQGKNLDEDEYYLYLYLPEAYLAMKGQIEKKDDEYLIKIHFSDEMIFGLIALYQQKKLISSKLETSDFALVSVNYQKSEVAQYYKKLVLIYNNSVFFSNPKEECQEQFLLTNYIAVNVIAEINEKMAKKDSLRMKNLYSGEIEEIPLNQVKDYLIKAKIQNDRLIYQETVKIGYQALSDRQIPYCKTHLPKEDENYLYLIPLSENNKDNNCVVCGEKSICHVIKLQKFSSLINK